MNGDEQKFFMELLGGVEERTVNAINGVSKSVVTLATKIDVAQAHYLEQPKKCMDEVDKKLRNITTRKSGKVRWAVGILVGVVLGIPAWVLSAVALAGILR